MAQGFASKRPNWAYPSEHHICCPYTLTRIQRHCNGCDLFGTQGTDELGQPGFMKLHAARGDSPIATFQVDVAPDNVASHHKQARPFLFEAILPPQESSAAGSVTYDIKVSNWRCAGSAWLCYSIA